MISHSVPLVSMIAVGLGLSLVLGFLAARLKLPALVGYLVAGTLIGPFTPGFVANVEIANELAEIGVILLMFGVGLHFSLSDLLSVRKVALPGALLQMAVATALGMSFGIGWGWSIGGSLIFGLSLSVASTVVLLRTLETRGALESVNGRIAIGWLVVEDVMMVLVLVLLPPLAGWLGGHSPESDQSVWWALLITLLKISAFVVVMVVFGGRVFPKLLWSVARTGSRELFTLCVVAIAVSSAYGAAKLFGVSFALGAFFAGMMLRESEFSHRAVKESLPLREAFMVLFFVAVGMLFDPRILIKHPFEVFVVVSIIVVGKSIVAALLVLMFRYSLSTAFMVSASLAQIGEFSFILAGLGVTLGLLPLEGQSLILAGAIISMAINPFIFAMIWPLRIWLRSRSALARLLERSSDPLSKLPAKINKKYLSGQIVLIGYGWVGEHIGEVLKAQDIPYIVIEQNRELVERLRKRGIAAIFGDASDPTVLAQAHIREAGIVVVVSSDSFNIRLMLESVQALNPGIQIVVRTHNAEEAVLLQQEKVGKVFLAEDELAKGMCQFLLVHYGKVL